MFTANFELHDGAYFYVLTDANEVASLAVGEETVTAAPDVPGSRVARWRIPTGADNFVKINIYRLMDHPTFLPLLETKAKLIQIFKSVKSEESERTLVNFMTNAIEILTETLRMAHRLYWKDDVRKIRSRYTFEECIQISTNFANLKLKVLNIVTDSQNNNAIQSTVINSQLRDIARNNIRSLGYKESEITSKKIKKKK